MLSLIANLFATKASVHIMMRGSILASAGLTLQAIVQSSHLNGFMRIRPGAFVQIDLEGSQPQLEAVIAQLRQVHVGSGTILLENSWGPYKHEFENFHASL